MLVAEAMSDFIVGMPSKLTQERLRRNASGLRRAMFLVAGGVMSSYVRVVLQAVSAAMSQVLQQHTRTRLKNVF